MIIVTQEQLDMIFTQEICDYLGITEEIKEYLDSIDFVLCLENTYVGDKIEREDGRFEITGNISNAKKMPRRVAIRDLTEQDLEFWKKLVGEENIIT